MLLFIDELPCFDTKNSRFLNAFGNFWNDWCNKRPQVMLIVCGSATTWMIKNIVDNHGGLHNRMTHKLPLHPFTLAETEEYFKANGILWDQLAIIGMYSVLGGIPYYLSLIQNNESVSQAFDRLFFGSSSEMRGEYVLKKEEDLKIRNRIEAYKSESNTKCAVMPVLVTTYGLQKNTYSGNIRNIIVMDDLFAK